MESWHGALLSVERGPDAVECARSLADSVSGCGDGSQSLKPWTSQPGGLLRTHALQQQSMCLKHVLEATSHLCFIPQM